MPNIEISSLRSCKISRFGWKIASWIRLVLRKMCELSWCVTLVKRWGYQITGIFPLCV